MRKKTTLGFLGLGLLGLGMYGLRRQWIGRWLHLQPARNGVVIKRDLGIQMPDGVKLVMDHYIPKGERLYPTILIRTPYSRNPKGGLFSLLTDFVAQRFAERGYNVLVQDVRGRFESQGEFIPFVDEAADGRATLDWIEKQPWFNGLLGMWGQSYVGYVQWAVAPGAPLYLKALVPGITGSSLPLFCIRDGALQMDTILRWVLQLDAMDRKGWLAKLLGLLRLVPDLQDRILNRTFTQLPLLQADQKLVGKPVQYYRDWLTHPNSDDPYWKALDFSSQVGRVNASVHMVSGWYDILLRELLDDYAALRASGRSPYLTIGPWHHLDLECVSETIRQGLIWFDAILKGDRSRLRKAPVRLFIMGGGGWREYESWPPPSKPVRYYLRTPIDGLGQGDVALSNDCPASDELPDTYTFDPAHPTPSVGGAMMNVRAGAADNRALEARSDVITYTTPPMDNDLEVIGAACLELYVRSSQAFTDFFARLCDVHPDGRSINVCDGFLRMQPGVGDPQPDGSLRIEIPLWPFANRFARGHSVRLLISSGAFPRYSPNPGSGEPLASATQILPSEQVIYHDLTHPSRLILPKA
jgi:uncharacterized protein